ncbi:hypothetical protein NL676_008644 [Syzygium grande]|nr:hypothetical protein NL676_008644 [Syzygium grande]
MASVSSALRNVQPQLPRFDGKNFEHWKIQMEVLFEFQELAKIIEEGFVEASGSRFDNGGAEDDKVLYGGHKGKALDQTTMVILDGRDHSAFSRPATGELTVEIHLSKEDSLKTTLIRVNLRADLAAKIADFIKTHG